jgi:hypothetical protein
MVAQRTLDRRGGQRSVGGSETVPLDDLGRKRASGFSALVDIRPGKL